MFETIPSAALLGLQAYRVQVEVAITRGTPMIQVVGLPESAVREGKERIRAAANQMGLHVPGLRITVNLAPAAVRKGGAAFDLPILVGILAAWGKLPGERCRRWAMAGELGLDGRLRAVEGALPLALHAREAGDVDGLILPRDNLGEVRPVREFPVRGADDLEDVIRFLRDGRRLPGPGDVPAVEPWTPDGPEPDLSDVYGQEQVKRALIVAAAGGHNVLLQGTPGSGKTMLARRLPTLLPELSLAQAVEATAIHSVAGRIPPRAGVLRRRPFRAPHHTVSRAGLIGGGAIPKPGEVSLAHHGVLFLDELSEFGRASLEALRQPLEEGIVTLVRARAAVSYPARVHLVAAMNPCPCGYRTGEPERCTCDPGTVRTYRNRISGPLMDRIDMHVQVSPVRWRELRGGPKGETSEAVRERVHEARRRAARRLADSRGVAGGVGGAEGNGRPEGGGRADGNGRTGRGPVDGPVRGWQRPDGDAFLINASLTVPEIERFCALDGRSEALLRRAVENHRLSARTYHRLLRIARTIADLAGAERLTHDHVAEAIAHRVPPGDRSV